MERAEVYRVFIILLLAISSDAEKLLVNNEFIERNGTVKGFVMIPCQPTSPDVVMTLTKDGNKIIMGRQNDSDLIASFDPTIGFTLSNLALSDSGYYDCHASLGKYSDQRPVYLTVEVSKTVTVVKPVILDNVPQLFLLREGEDLMLRCETVAEKGTTFDAKWTTPNNLTPKYTVNHCKQGSYACKIVILSIKNITAEDGGIYTCFIKLKNGMEERTSKELKVIARNSSYFNFSSDSNRTLHIKVANNTPLNIVVNILAPGKPMFNWIGPHGRKLHSDGKKYVIMNEGSQSILRVKNITLRDAGNYTLVAYDDFGKGSFERTVIIHDIPNVILHHSQLLYTLGSVVNFSCTVLSPAPVDIRWYFKTCDLRKPHDCDAENEFKQKDTTKHMDVFNRTYDMSLIHLVATQGVLRCVANNSIGSANATLNIYVTELENPDNIPRIIEESDEIVREDNFTLTCASTVYNATQYPTWFKGTLELSNASSGFVVTKERRDFTYYSHLMFLNASRKNHDGDYDCFIISSDKNKTLVKAVQVQDPEAPVIYESNLEAIQNLETKLGSNLTLTCRANGKPRPTILWYREDKLIISDNTVALEDHNQTLKIKFLKADHDGKYHCKAQNRINIADKYGVITIADKEAAVGPSVIAVIVICVIALVIMIIVLLVKVQKEKKLQRELNLAGLANFEKGALESINPELPVDEQADLLPYDKSWEFPRDKLHLGKQLGAGAFGVVMKAEAWGILDDEEKTTVAVKMAKIGADRSFIKALASELKIMAHLGKHLNVVNLLGASTKNLAKMELFVIVEFCRFGNIHNYLLRHRDDFVDQLDRTTGELNLAIGIEKLSRSQSTKNKPTLKHRLLSYTSSAMGGNYSGNNSPDLRSPTSPRLTDFSTIASDMTVVSSPSGEPDECLLSSTSTEQPEWRVKYSGDYKGTTMPVCSQDLLCWAYQISRGMEYLVSRKVLHGDLAARNVLLADDNIVKICDFGLAKSMYKSENYKKKTAGPLPVKWMALESIRDRVFSTQSDVWSFGIVLWELFSLAQTPYPGMEADQNLYLKLIDGYRMEKPYYTPDEVYRIMKKCWEANPSERPSFVELAEQLGALLDDNLRRHFEEMNNPYIDMNERNLQSDYLNMMCSPDYNNIVAPGGDNDYVNNRQSCFDDGPTTPKLISPLTTDDSIFNFSKQETSGYLTMMGRDSIFSPGHVEANPFSFPTSQEKKDNSEDKKHMTELKAAGPDNYVNMGQNAKDPTSFENPSYIMTKTSRL